MKELKQVTKSATKLSRDDLYEFFKSPLSFGLINNLLELDISDVRYYLREQLVTKSVTKIIELIDFLATEKSREEIFRFLEIDNQAKNFNTNIKPLLEYGIIEQTVPDKPRSRNQKYRLTEKGKKLLKS